MYGENGLAAATLPTLIFANTEDRSCPYDRDTEFIYEHLGSEDRYLISLIGADHQTPFGDSGVQATFYHFTMAFFGYYLQGQEDYADYLTEEYVAGFDDVAWGVYEGE